MLIRPGSALLAGLLLLPGAADALERPRDRMLVSPAWLKAHLADRNLVLLQVGEKEEYDREHIPGARFLDFRSISHRSESGLFLEMPTLAKLDSNFAALGVTRTSRIVLYFGSDWVSPTTRAWLTLEYMGHGARASLLDGGLPAWKSAGGAVTAEVPPAVTPQPLASTGTPALLVDSKWIAARLAQPRFRVIDARDSEFYEGLDPGSGTRPGHLPGARSIPFTTVTDSAGRFLADTALERLFREAGVRRGDEIVAYCHIGQQATAVWFASRRAGLTVRLYDGSFEDWAAHDDFPLEKP
jgi:thiosulfate/3-mercaptopyruvate sulfurtransferase